MQKLKHILLNLKVFMIAFFICNLFSMCLFTKRIYSICIPLLILWGGLLCVYNYVIKRQKKDFAFWVSSAVCINYLIIILFFSSSYMQDIAQLLCVMVYLFILFGAFSDLDRKDRTDIIMSNCYIMFYFNIVVSLGSVIIMFSKYVGEIVIEGDTYLLGLIPRSSGCQLRGIGGSPTSFSVLEWLSIVASIFIFKRSKSKLNKVVVVIADIVSWICLVGANSNYFILMFGVFGIMLFICNLINKKWKNCLVVIIGMFSVLILYQGTLKGIDYTVNNVDISQILDKIQIDDDTASTDTEKQDVVDSEAGDVKVERSISSSTLSVRMSIWKEALKILKDHPFGVAKSNATVEIYYGRPNYKYTNLHNGYLTILVASGIQGFALIILFGVWLFIKVIKCLAKNNNTNIRLIVSLCVAILAGEMVNGCFLFDRGLTYASLWPLLGYLYSECKLSDNVMQ